MVRHGVLDELIVDGEHSQRASFVHAHLATKADDVGEYDRGELALATRGRDLAGRCVCGHEQGLILLIPRLSTLFSQSGKPLISKELRIKSNVHPNVISFT